MTLTISLETGFFQNKSGNFFWDNHFLNFTLGMGLTIGVFRGRAVK